MRTRVAREAALRGLLWLLLGGWIGSWFLFGAVVAPTAFRVLPTTEIAGSLVGPVLTALHLYGAAAGLGLGVLGLALRRPAWLGALPFLLGALCLYSHFGVTGEMSEIRDLTFGPEGNVEAAARFQELHRRSLAIFIGVGVAAIGVLAGHAAQDARERFGVPRGAAGSDGTDRKPTKIP